MNLSENEHGPQMRCSVQGSPWPLPAFASCRGSCRALRPEPLGQRNNCLVFSPEMKIATSSWPGVQGWGVDAAWGNGGGGGLCGGDVASPARVSPEGLPRPAPGQPPAPPPPDRLHRHSEAAALLSPPPTSYFFPVAGYVSGPSHPMGTSTST